MRDVRVKAPIVVPLSIEQEWRERILALLADARDVRISAPLIVYPDGASMDDVDDLIRAAMPDS